jgi:hypothetical protein
MALVINPQISLAKGCLVMISSCAFHINMIRHSAKLRPKSQVQKIPKNPPRATSRYKEFIKLGLKSEVNRNALQNKIKLRAATPP